MGAGDPISSGSLYAGADIADKALPCNVLPSFRRSRDKSIDRHATEIPTVKMGEIQLCIAQVNPRTAWWAGQKEPSTAHQMTPDNRG